MVSENFSAGVMARLGFGYEALRAIKQGIIFMLISAQWQPVWYAWLSPPRGGGQFIDVSMHAASNVTTEAGTYEWLVAQQTVRRQTGRHTGVTPSGPTQEQAKDGRWITSGLFARRPQEFRIIIDWLHELGLYEQFEQAPLLEVAAGMDRMLERSRAAEDEQEAALLGAAREAMIFFARHLDAYAFFQGAQDCGFQVGIIYAPEEVIADPHFVARGFPTEVEHRELGRSFVYPGAPYAFRGSPWAISRRPPLLGEHTAEVLAELDPS